MKPGPSAPFLELWGWYHTGSIPVGHTLKHSEAPRWLRFHSLPESKRYAETEAEMAIVLGRLNDFGDEVLGDAADCWMVTAIWVPATAEDEENSGLEWRSMHTETIAAWMLEPVTRLWCEDDEITYDIYANRIVWSRSRFDSILRSIAEDELRVFWMSAENGAIFAPYDGGVDLILPDATHIVRLTAKYSDWLPSTPSCY